MIEAFVYATLSIALIWILNNTLQIAKVGKFYFAFFILIFGFSCLLKGCLYTEEIDYSSNELIEEIDYSASSIELAELKYLFETKLLTPTQRRDCETKMLKHKKEGQKYIKIAEDCIPLFPKVDDQDLLEVFFATAVAACVDGLTWSTAVIGIGTSCVKYGLNVYKEYKKLDKNLKCAAHEFEMMEFYQMLLDEG